MYIIDCSFFTYHALPFPAFPLSPTSLMSLHPAISLLLSPPLPTTTTTTHARGLSCRYYLLELLTGSPVGIAAGSEKKVIPIEADRYSGRNKENPHPQPRRRTHVSSTHDPCVFLVTRPHLTYALLPCDPSTHDPCGSLMLPRPQLIHGGLKRLPTELTVIIFIIKEPDKKSKVTG